MAHASGGVCHVPHGIANAIFLPWGVEYNIEKCAGHIAELLPLFGKPETGDAAADAKAVVQAIHDLNKKLNGLCGMPIKLKDADVPEDKLEEIAKVAINDGTIAMNPEEVTFDDALAVLKKAF